VTVLLFISTAAVIVLAGTNLSRYGDVIAERSGLGRTFVGLVLTASITSLPELVTGFSSVVLHDAPEVAVGDVAGSLVFNLLLLVLIDALAPAGTPAPDFRSGHAILLGGTALGTLAVAAALAWPSELPGLARVGTVTPVLAVLYFGALRWVYVRNRPAEAPGPEPDGVSLRQAVGLYAANAALVVVSAGFLPKLAVDLADHTGLGQSFVGAAIVGAVTSLPEFAVTVSAVRLRALDLAVAGLLGSNLFDLLILALDDVAYAPGPLLAAVSKAHLVPLLTAVLMSGVLAAAVRLGAWPGRTRRFSAASLLLLGLYGAQLVVMYLRRAAG
jgi:cation:H+ antiporter